VCEILAKLKNLLANVVRLNDVTQAQTRHENYSGSVKMTFNKRRFADLTN